MTPQEVRQTIVKATVQIALLNNVESKELQELLKELALTIGHNLQYNK